MLDDHKAKLLIVDDLPENLQALSKIIEQDDRIIYSAQSGDAALGYCWSMNSLSPFSM
jgi:CheY-like chemotaxis protein